MVFYLKPVQWIAIILTTIALAFFITAIVTPNWMVVDNINSNQQWGVYQACWQQYGINQGSWINECRYIDNNCRVDFSIQQSDGSDYLVPWERCPRTRAVRALSVLAAIFTMLAIIPMLATACLFHDLALRLAAFILLMTGSIFGAIAFGIFSDLAFVPRWRYGYSYGLLCAAWVIGIIASILTLFPHRIHAPAVAETRDTHLINNGTAAVPLHRSSVSAHGSAPATATRMPESEMPVRIHGGEETIIQQQV